MAKDRSKTPEDGAGAPSKRLRRSASHSETDYSSESDDEPRRRHRRSKTKGKRKSREDEDDSYTSSSSESDYSSDSGSVAGSDAEAGSTEEDRRRRKRKRKEEERRRRKDKERERKRKRRKEREEREDRKRRKKKKKKNKDKGKLGAVTNSWGKYGIIRETDMWNKRPEFTAWLLEVKKVNLESLPNYEEKQMFKQFMEDHNTATFTSKKYYNLDAYHQRKMEKEMKRGAKHVQVTERTVFDDEEQRRQEMMQVRERQKQAEVKSLMQAMQSGMAQAMKEQAQLKEEMAYQYKIGNFEAAAAIQRRLEPDPPA